MTKLILIHPASYESQSLTYSNERKLVNLASSDPFVVSAVKVGQYWEVRFSDIHGALEFIFKLGKSGFDYQQISYNFNNL